MWFSEAEESTVVKGSLYHAFATMIQCMEQNQLDAAATRGQVPDVLSKYCSGLIHAHLGLFKDIGLYVVS